VLATLFPHCTIIMTTLLHPFNGLFSRTTWVSRHQKAKPFWILLEQEMMGWQWHQLDHMQIIRTSLQTDNHASTSPLSFYRPDDLPAAQPTASKHWRQIIIIVKYLTADLATRPLHHKSNTLNATVPPQNAENQNLSCSQWRLTYLQKQHQKGLN